jgi:hypothetical protein
MRRGHRIRPIVVAAAVTLVAPALLTGQSLTSARGAGYPLLPSDARTSIMGGLGVGLHGYGAPLINPAAAAHTLRRGAIVAAEGTERVIRLGEGEEAVGSMRFPLMQLVFPTRRAVWTVGYGGYLDQGWGLTRTGEETLPGGALGYTETIISDGGVGQFQLGAAVPLGERLAVGVSVAALTGTQRVDFDRRFEAGLDAVPEPYIERLAWRYSGMLAQVGVRWDPNDLVRVGASATWAGDLTGEPTSGRATARDLDLPLQVAGGASAFLVPGLLAAVSGRWSGWSATDPAIGLPLPGDGPDRASRDTWELGGGLEWVAPRPGARRHFPLRAGVQYRQLPFPFADDAPSEWFAGVGTGMRIGDARNPLAALDLGVQRGQRTAAGAGAIADLTESMWRIQFSLSLFGN